MIYIGITGKAGSGKDTLGRMIATKLTEFQKSITIMAFGNPIKDIAVAMGFKEEQIKDPVLKNDIDENWGISPRKFMQICGTELFRNNFRADCLVKAAEIRIKEYSLHRDVIIFTDVRYKNEAEFIIERGGIIIEIERPYTDKAADWRKHPSESGIAEKYIHIKIINNAGTDELERTAKSLAGYILCQSFKKKELYCSDF
ncbi:MAG: hypothetical protein A2017_06415 [Lentisphaerae bacterium GWF2_44_16]|nr:MAG: hypothetical protein A2017_06415 [Lentisphaerae bacterium GWF2_44_16]